MHSTSAPPQSCGPGAIRVLQITDTHLYADPARRLLGVDTDRSCLDVLDCARRDRWPADLLLLTGDLAQDGSAQAYRRLRERFGALRVPTYALPGNHDDPPAMLRELRATTISMARATLHGKWQLVLLDTRVAGAAHGHLDKAELEALDAALSARRARHALIAMHHPPVAVGSRWIDELAVDNAADFFAVLARHPQVRGVVWGHVHQEYAAWHRGVRLLGSPSTCFQFKPRKDDFALDEEAPPGYRWLVLRPDGVIETGVRRLEHRLLGMEIHSAGY
jgi:3',5'-cyclic-AMP phosphodiesterase